MPSTSPPSVTAPADSHAAGHPLPPTTQAPAPAPNPAHEAAWNRFFGRGFYALIFLALLNITLRQALFADSTTFAHAPAWWTVACLVPILGMLWLPWQRMGRPTPRAARTLWVSLFAGMGAVWGFMWMGGIRPWWQLPIISAAVAIIAVRMGRHAFPGSSWLARSRQRLWRLPLNNAQTLVLATGVAFAGISWWVTVHNRLGEPTEAHLMARGIFVFVALVVFWVSQAVWATQGRSRQAIHEDLAMTVLWVCTAWLAVLNATGPWLDAHSTTDVVSGSTVVVASIGVVALATVHMVGGKRWAPVFILVAFPALFGVALSFGKVPVLTLLPLVAWALGTFVPRQRVVWSGVAWGAMLGMVFVVHGWRPHAATHALMSTWVLLLSLYVSHHPQGLMALAQSAPALPPLGDAQPPALDPKDSASSVLDPAVLALIQRRINHIGVAVALGVLAVGLSAWWTWLNTQRAADAVVQSQRLKRWGETLSHQLWSVEQAAFKLGLLADHNALDDTTFRVWASKEIQQLPPGTDLQWAHQGKLTHSHPSPLPPTLQGMDVRDLRNHQIGAQIKQASALGNALWTDPFELIEGGLAMARYTPVYNHASHRDDGMPTFIGFSVGLMRFPQALEETFTAGQGSDLPTEIWSSTRTGTDVLLYRSGPRIPHEDPSWMTDTVAFNRWDQTRFADIDLINPTPRGSQISFNVRVAPSDLGLWGQPAFAWQALVMLAVLLGWLARHIAGTRLTLVQTERMSQRIQSAKALVDEAIVGMALFDANGRHLLSNRAVYDLIGAPPEAFTTTNLRDLPPVLASQQAPFATLQDGFERDILYEGHSLWGRPVCVSVHFKRIVLDDQPIVLMQVVDQRSNREAQRKLEKSLNRLAIAANFGGTLFWSHDLAEDRIPPISGFEAFMGLPQSDAPYADYVARLHPDDQAAMRHCYLTTLRTGQVQALVCRYHHPDGTWRHHKTSLQASLNPATGRADEVFGVTADITLLMNEQDARQRLNAQMAQILNALPQMVVVRRLDGEDDAPSEFVNRAYREKMGLTADEPLKAPLIQRLVGPAAAQAHRQRKAQHFTTSQATFHDVLEGHNIAGEFISLSITSAVFTGIDGTPRIINTLTDITPLTLALRQAQKADDAKTQFLATMSHEMRTPLGAALGYAQLLQATSLNDAQARLLHKLSVSGSMLMEIINNILDLSRIEADELVLSHAPFAWDHVRRVIEDMFGALAEQRGLTLTVAPLPPELAPMHLGDELRVRQILTNLVGNALKFTPQGSVQVRFTCLPYPDSTRQALRIEVQDSGIGIAADQQSKLFHRFTQVDGTQTRGFGGTGLGLAIVKELAQHMGGGVQVRSQAGQGSTFVVDMVLEVAPAEAHLEANGPQDPLQAIKASAQALAGLRILVVDDNPMNLEVTEAMLSKHGAQVDTALNGLEAVEWVQAHPNAAHLVLMDVHMPLMDGLTATQRIRALPHGTGLPILAVSAGALNSEINTALQTGMNGYLLKPFEEAQLVRTVRQHALPGEAPPAADTENVPPPAVAVAESRDDAVTAAETGAETDAEADWPDMPGIDLATVPAPLNQDRALHARQLGHLLRTAQSRPLAVATPDDAAPLAAHIHKLTGMASILGATDLATHARAAEQALKQHQPADDALQTLRDALSQLTRDTAPALAHGRAIGQAEREAARAHPPALDAASLQALLTDLGKRRFTSVRRYQQLRLAIHARLGDADADALDEAMDTPNFPLAEGLLVPLLRFL